MRVSLIIVCTGKYDRFLQPLIDSAEEWFFKGEEYDIYLFTDAPNRPPKARRGEVHVQPIEHVPFPFATLYRYKYMSEHRDWFTADNLFYIDVDMRFVGAIAEEILPDHRGLVAIRHPGFWKTGWGSRKTHYKSLAYVPPDMQFGYMCGGIQGGTRDAYLNAADEMWNNILIDFEVASQIGFTDNCGILAEYHDESHWNAYLKKHPFKALPPSYCYPETWHIPFERRILALKKNMREVR